MKDEKWMQERLVKARSTYMISIDKINALNGKKSDMSDVIWFTACRAQSEIKLLEEMLEIPSEDPGQEERGDTDGSH